MIMRSSALNRERGRSSEVQIGELRGTDVEVLSGLKAGDRVLGQGAILLKPIVVRCLQSVDSPSKGVTASDRRGGSDR